MFTSSLIEWTSVLETTFFHRLPRLSGKCGMTSRFGMETRIHSVKCYESKGACRRNLTHRSGVINCGLFAISSLCDSYRKLQAFLNR